MSGKRRTYGEYRELGAGLYGIREDLIKSLGNCGRLFGKTRPETKAVRKALAALDEVRSKIDDTYCREIPETSTPAEGPRFPMYPGGGG